MSGVLGRLLGPRPRWGGAVVGIERRLPDWLTDDLADLLAELDTAVTL